MNESANNSSGLLTKALAVVVIVLVGFFLLKIVFGFLAGLVVTLFWIAIIVLAVMALVWAIRRI
jgi:hypothetical protein